MSPTDAQIRAIKNQAKFPGVNASIPKTSKEASVQIAANSQIINSRKAGRPPVQTREYRLTERPQYAPSPPRPSEATMNLIRKIEKAMGHLWLTYPEQIGAPKTQFEAIGLLQSLIGRLRRRYKY